MKKILLFGLTFCVGIGFAQQETPTFERCLSHKFIEYQDQKTPGFAKHVDEQFEIAKNNNFEKSNETYTIPVVVHVVYNTPEQNLPDSVIHNQIETLNEDYQRRNADTVNMRSDFDIVAGSPNIRFKLATIDPNGDPTTGITRTSTNTSSFMDMAGFLQNDMSSMEAVKKEAEGGIDPWEQSRYMNIWVCNMAADLGGSSIPMLLGYATPPTGLSNWPAGSTGGLNDGVVIQFEAFGANNPNELGGGMGAAPGEVLGRTTTHEVGHYLGLRHIWGDGDCNEQDGIDDTPNAMDKSEQDCDTTKNTCVDDIQGIDLPDMIENYMDYSAETCQNSFTKGQASLMRGVLENQRYDLVNGNPASVETEELKAALYPNPTNNELNIQMNNGTIKEVKVYNAHGQVLLTEASPNNAVYLDVSSFNKGVYFVKIYSDNGSLVKRFIKN